ncbi:MAG: uroporphyrinogen-III decarboxylase-like protein, partial [Bacteroidetes bacterium]|nr:uroporphyrinogen-III decarboxylase-like protein [Bacteroidota bacterium]
MTPRERWLAILSGERPDRIPTDYWATDEVTRRLQREFGCPDKEAVYTKLNIDGLYHVDVPRKFPGHPDFPGADMWGVQKKLVDYGSGTYEESASHPLESVLTVEDVHRYPWPSPDDVDFEAVKHSLRKAPAYRMVRCGEFEPFLTYCAMRGMELSFMDLLAEPDIADAILGHLFDYHYRLNERLFELGKGQIDIMYIAEDLGAQSGLLMGLDQIERYILPNQKKMADLARSYGIHIFYHTDGSARDVIPRLLDVTGIEILNPIQWRCPGMEREGLVRDFGKRVIFHGAVD